MLGRYRKDVLGRYIQVVFGWGEGDYMHFKKEI